MEMEDLTRCSWMLKWKKCLPDPAHAKIAQTSSMWLSSSAIRTLKSVIHNDSKIMTAIVSVFLFLFSKGLFSISQVSFYTFSFITFLVCHFVAFFLSPFDDKNVKKVCEWHARWIDSFRWIDSIHFHNQSWCRVSHFSFQRIQISFQRIQIANLLLLWHKVSYDIHACTHIFIINAVFVINFNFVNIKISSKYKQELKIS